MVNNLFREFLAELIGTFILVLFGLSGCASSVLPNIGSAFYPAISFGAGAFIATFSCGYISGAHLNPAITLALCTIRKFSWRKVPVYFAAQYLGAFLASGIIYILYFESMKGYDKQYHHGTASEATASIFVTFPSPYISIVPAVIDQVLGTGLLAFAILFITDESFFRTPPTIQALAIGFSLFAIIAAFNYNCGAPLNPARDLAPRIFLTIYGYHNIVFSPIKGWYWLAVGIIGPHIGAILGSFSYLGFVKLRKANSENREILVESKESFNLEIIN